jgi:TIR domain/AAA ATPase domain
MSDVSTKPVIFISYSRKDEPEKPARGQEKWRTYVQSYLAPANLNGLVHIFVDEDIRGGEEWRKKIDAQLSSCDLFILLVSINSLASNEVMNFEIKAIQERQARGEHVHIFPIVLDPFSAKTAPWLMKLNLRPPSGKPLSDYKLQDRKKQMVAIVDEVIDIVREIVAAKQARLESIRSAPPAPAEVSAGCLVDIAYLPETPYARLIGRESQLSRLDEAWSNGRTNIVSLIAEGGAGKSALVNEWLKRMQADGYRGAEVVLGWSFYDQGTEESASSAESFLDWAVEKLGIRIERADAEDKGEAIAAAKGEAIAAALVQRRMLLVLDGCEPLQHALARRGELKDRGLRALLRRFASAPANRARGLILLTSRYAIKDIARWKETSAPIEELYRLSDETGAALARENGVWGTDEELQAASRDFGGHPLALGLLASYLKDKHADDVRERVAIGGASDDHLGTRQPDHAKRVIATYEKEWLAGKPLEHAIMNLIGLFDRPATDECLRALRRPPAIPGLTEAVMDLSEEEWEQAVARLREARLLTPADPSTPHSLDAHPLVREWFGERLKQVNDVAWKAAHALLFDYLQDSTKEGTQPTLEDLAPLYQAIGHGCRAGKYQEALDRIYIGRICRLSLDGRPEFYSTLKLGAYASDLAALFWFFERAYDLPVDALTELARIWVVSIASNCLAAQGRMSEALSGQRKALQTQKDANDLTNVAVGAANISHGEIITGQIFNAVESAKESVAYADATRLPAWTVLCRVSLANALHAFGKSAEAERVFAEAEQRQKVVQPGYPMLYGVSGYYFCDLLLAKGDYAAVEERASRILEWARTHLSHVDTALSTLALARAAFGLAISRDSDARRSSEVAQFISRSIDETIELLRKIRMGGHLPPALLARAAFRRAVGDWAPSARDLDEIEEIAEPGPMKVFLCDIALERARLVFARIEAFVPLNGLIDDGTSQPTAPDAVETAQLIDEATKQLIIAADYISTCGYHRRDEELAELQSVLRGERKFADLPPRV